MFRDFIRDESGQGTTEYVLIIALVAVVCVAAVKVFGGKILDLIKGSTEKISSETAGFNSGSGQ